MGTGVPFAPLPFGHAQLLMSTIYNSFIIKHIDNKTKFEEKILSTSLYFGILLSKC